MTTFSDTSCESPAAPPWSQGGGAARLRDWIGQRLSAGALLSIVDQAVVSGTSFATSVIIGRVCGRAELGLYSLGLNVVLLVLAVQGCLISSPYQVYCHRRQGRSLASYTSSVLVHQGIFTLLAFVVVLALVGAAATTASFAAWLPVAWGVLAALPFLLWRQFTRHQSFARFRLVAAVALDVSVAVCQLGALLLLARNGLLTVARAFLVMGACCALACLVGALAKRRPVRLRRRRIVADWRQNWSFARWALASQLVNDGARFATPWIIALLHSEAATGALAACTTIANLASTFITGVSNLLTPKAAHAYARGGAPALRRVLRKTALLFLLTVGGFCLLMLVAGEPVIRFVFGGQYAGFGPVVGVLALGTLASSLGVTAGNGLWAIDRPRTNFLADVATLAVTAAGLICLAAPLGVMGAALALTGGAVVGAGIRGFTLRRLMREISLEPRFA